MTTVGSYEAKTHLPRLLERVAKGEKITITKRGKPIAVLVPPSSQGTPDTRRVVREMLALRDRDGPSLGGKTTLRELVEQGRRF